MNKYVALFFALLLTFPNLVFSKNDDQNNQPVYQNGQNASGVKVYPEKLEADKNFDGIPDYAEHYKNGKLELREADVDFDGKMDEWTYFNEAGKPIKTGRDTNKDGKPDVWIYYQN